MSAGRVIFILRAATPIAPSKHADQPAANNCSGLVPEPVVPGVECLISRRPSSLLEVPPFRPPEVWTLAVYNTFLSWGAVIIALKFICLRAGNHMQRDQ